ncbi:hypothetical protein D3C77_773590 [compost metagenome]
MAGIAQPDFIGNLRQAVAGIEQPPARLLQAHFQPPGLGAHAVAGLELSIELPTADAQLCRQVLDRQR